VFITKEKSKNLWESVFEYKEHKHSVNSVAFAPHEYGLILLCGSSDGYVSIHEYKSKIKNNINKQMKPGIVKNMKRMILGLHLFLGPHLFILFHSKKTIFAIKT